MAYIYSSNSPYYLDYLADNMSREEILADPDLCQLLENPYLKDNMELALRYHDAKTGGYEEKKDFVEYMYANGPEIDTDTLMYYRDKCYQDPVYLEIAELEFSDLTVVDLLRESKYGKKNDMEDCFTQPCNYLGPLSASIGIMGDSNNFRTCNNVFSQLLGLGKKQKEEDEKAEADKKAGKKAKDGATKKKTDGEKEEEKDDIGLIWGYIRQTVTPQIIPLFQQSYAILYNNVYEHMKDFADECNKAGIASTAHIGDPMAIPRAEAIDGATKVNIMHDLGDCARIWEQMRRYNPYDSSQNKKGPLGHDKIKNNKTIGGSAIDTKSTKGVTRHLSKHKLQEQAAGGNEAAKCMLFLQEFMIPFTQEDVDRLKIRLWMGDNPEVIKKDIVAKMKKMWTYEDWPSENDFYKKFGKNETTKKVYSEMVEKQHQMYNKADYFVKHVMSAIKRQQEINAQNPPPSVDILDAEKWLSDNTEPTAQEIMDALPEDGQIKTTTGLAGEPAKMIYQNGEWHVLPTQAQQQMMTNAIKANQEGSMTPQLDDNGQPIDAKKVEEKLPKAKPDGKPWYQTWAEGANSGFIQSN